MTTSHHNLLRCALRVALELEGVETLEVALRAWGEAELEALDQTAAQEGLSGLLGALTRRPPFHPTYYANLAHHLAAEAALRSLAKVLEPTPILTLKGVSLLQTVYAGRAGARPMADVDLLFPDSNALERAKNALLERGYNTWLGNPTLLGVQPPRGARVLFDLHTPDALTGADRFQRLRTGLRFDVDALWRRAEPLFSDATQPNLLRMGDADLLAHAIVHALKHGFSRGIWLLDIAALRGRVEPETERRRLAAIGGSRALACADALLHTTLGLARRHPELRLNPVERWMLRSIARREPIRGVGTALLVTSLPTWRDKATYLAEVVLLREELSTREAHGEPVWRVHLRRAARAAGLLGKLLSR